MWGVLDIDCTITCIGLDAIEGKTHRYVSPLTRLFREQGNEDLNGVGHDWNLIVEV